MDDIVPNDTTDERFVRTRFGCWENSITNHTDIRAAWISALQRSVDVIEDLGTSLPVSWIRLQGGGHIPAGTSLLTTTMAQAQLPFRRNPRGWELSRHPSLESRRATGLNRHVWDVAEELVPGKAERVMVPVMGPWSVGASVEWQGHAILRDRPAFRDMALTLGYAVSDWVTDLAKLCGGAEQVVVNVHEPMLPQVLDGLAGATPWFDLPPVDPEHIRGVWMRMVAALPAGTHVVLHAPSTQPTVLRRCVEPGDVDRIVVQDVTSMHLAIAPANITAEKDAVGQWLGAGQPIGWQPALGRNDSPESIARAVLRQWKEWRLDAAGLPHLVDLVVEEAHRTVAEAAEAAALIRRAGALLWHN